ncbi:MAG: serine/threonine-protein kinase [Gammaproteobacteria bacterium]
MSSQTPSLPAIPGYRLRKILGRGGMATVFLGEPESGGRKVAIKVMRAPPGETREWSERFLREAAMLQRLDHPNIIKVETAGESAGDHYMVMEYLDHGDLTSWIRQSLKPEDALRLLRQLALALDAAHTLGYVHRDVKPDNVLFRADGTPVLTDFGIARQRGNDQRLTQMGMAIGTPAYMSPEQHKGLDVDGRTDIYALGVIFHEMLTKKVPYDGTDSVSIGIRHLQDPLPQLPASLARFQRFLDSLLAKNPAERMARGSSVVKAIDLLLEQPEPTAKRAIAAVNALQRGLDVKETETKTGFLSKARDIAIDIGADDYETLQQHWSAATQTLFEWHREAGKKARNITLQFFVHPWILARVQDFVKRLAASEDYRFLVDLKATVRIHDLDGVLEAEIVLGEPAA